MPKIKTEEGPEKVFIKIGQGLRLQGIDFQVTKIRRKKIELTVIGDRVLIEGEEVKSE